MAGASLLAIECQPSRIEMRLRTGYLDMQAKSLDEALTVIERSCRERKPMSVAVLGNAAEILPELAQRGVKPDAVTDQTSAHDPVNGYLPAGWSIAEWEDRRAQGRRASRQTIDRDPCPRHAGVLATRRADARLRQQHPPDGDGNGRDQRL
jgi:urocanate hydratase